MNLFILRKKSYWSLEGSIIQTKIEMTRSSIITAVPPLYKNRYLDLRVVNGRIVDAATTRRSCNDGSRLDIIEIVTPRGRLIVVDRVKLPVRREIQRRSVCK